MRKGGELLYLDCDFAKREVGATLGDSELLECQHGHLPSAGVLVDEEVAEVLVSLVYFQTVLREVVG